MIRIVRPLSSLEQSFFVVSPYERVMDPRTNGSGRHADAVVVMAGARIIQNVRKT